MCLWNFYYEPLNSKYAIAKVWQKGEHICSVYVLSLYDKCMCFAIQQSLDQHC